METLSPRALPTTKHPPHLLLNAATTVHHLKQLHAHTVKCGVFYHIATPFFSKLLSLTTTSPLFLSYSLSVFRHVPDVTASLFNRFLRELSPHRPRMALAAYRRMRADGLPFDHFTFPQLLKAASWKNCYEEEGKELHGFVVKLGFDSDTFIQTALVRSYAVRGRVDDARMVFDHMTLRDVVAWGVMLDSYCQTGCYEDVLLLFEDMKESSSAKVDQVILVPVVVACARTANLSYGRLVHSYIIVNDIDVNDALHSALINMYANCGSLNSAQSLYDGMHGPKNLVASTAMVFGYSKAGKIEVARAIFDGMPEKDLVCWSAMISGYVESVRPSQALALFKEMREYGVVPDVITILSVISACSQLGALDYAKWVHMFVDRNGFRHWISVNNSLIDMYSKCGSLERAWRVFEEMPQQNVISWTSMITGLAMHGDGRNALRLFDWMRVERIEPNEVTFLGLLYACAHAGLVDDGCHIFVRMVHEYKIKPTIEHYGCMVDLFGRANLLDEALELARTMPFCPNAIILGSLLGAARLHGNTSLGEFAAKELLKIDPDHDGAYVLLSNIYAKARRWDAVGEVRKLMRCRGLLKERGGSWIELGGHVYEFTMGGESHPSSAEIYAMLDVVVKELRLVFCSEHGKHYGDW